MLKKYIINVFYRIDRLLQTTMQEEFDRMKKFISLLHQSGKEFMEYAKKNNDMFSQEEYKFIYKFLKERFALLIAICLTVSYNFSFYLDRVTLQICHYSRKYLNLLRVKFI